MRESVRSEWGTEMRPTLWGGTAWVTVVVLLPFFLGAGGVLAGAVSLSLTEGGRASSFLLRLRRWRPSCEEAASAKGASRRPATTATRPTHRQDHVVLLLVRGVLGKSLLLLRLRLSVKMVWVLRWWQDDGRSSLLLLRCC